MASRSHFPSSPQPYGPMARATGPSLDEIERQNKADAARNLREKATVIAVITAAVLVLFITPMLWLWASDRWKRRKKRQSDGPDLEGTTAASMKQRRTNQSLDPFLYGGSTLAASTKSISIITKQKCSKGPVQHPKRVTADQILGIDKTSCLRDIAPPNDGSSHVLNAAPVHVQTGRQRLSTAEAEGYINPWDAEHEPNPVMFPHLQTKSIFTESLHHDRSMRPHSLARPQEEDLGAHSLAKTISTIYRDNSDSVSPVSSMSSAPTSYASLENPPDTIKGKAPVIHPSVGRPSRTSISTIPLPSQEPCSDYQCQTCGMKCDTRGQLNTHVNRKHRRRYQCEHCTSAFALKADLKRHGRSVHSSLYAARAFYCPNPGCTISEKAFTRRDNYERHLRRCQNRQPS